MATYEHNLQRQLWSAAASELLSAICVFGGTVSIIAVGIYVVKMSAMLGERGSSYPRMQLSTLRIIRDEQQGYS